MCIIVYKAEGQKLPTNDMLENCYDNNPDGAGFMFIREGKINIRKGFMSFKALKKALALAALTHEDTIVYHFRIATHGKIDGKTTHPFPVSSRVRDLQATSFETQYACAHNGIVPIETTGNLSDTQTFIRDIVAPLGARLYKDGSIRKLVDMSTAGSKFLFWHTVHGILLTGQWQEYQGLKVSNDSHRERIYSMTPSPKWANWENKYANYFTKKSSLPVQPDYAPPFDDTVDCRFCGQPLTDEMLLEDNSYYCLACERITDVRS